MKILKYTIRDLMIQDCVFVLQLMPI